MPPIRAEPVGVGLPPGDGATITSRFLYKKRANADCFELIVWSSRRSPCSFVIGVGRFCTKLLATALADPEFGSGKRYFRTFRAMGEIWVGGITLPGNGVLLPGCLIVYGYAERSPVRKPKEGTLSTRTVCLGSFKAS